METFFYYSGVIAWVALGCGAILAGADTAINWIVQGLWTKRMFLEFVWDRLKSKNRTGKDEPHG